MLTKILLTIVAFSVVALGFLCILLLVYMLCGNSGGIPFWVFVSVILTSFVALASVILGVINSAHG